MAHKDEFLVAKANETHKQKIRIAHEQSNFIQKAYELVNNPNNADIIHWSKSGQSFVIENIEKFQNELLPLYFRHNRYQSFVRQLNMYDFHKIRNGDYYCDNKSEFRHEEFVRGNSKSIYQIKRKGFQAKTKLKDNSKNKKITKYVACKNDNRPKAAPKQKIRDSPAPEKSPFDQDENNSFFLNLSAEMEPEKDESKTYRQDEVDRIVSELLILYENKSSREFLKKCSKISESIQLAEQVKNKWMELFDKISGSDDIKVMKDIYYKVKEALVEKNCEESKKQELCATATKNSESQRNHMDTQFQMQEEEDTLIESIFRAEIRSTLICITSETFLHQGLNVRRYDTLMGI